MTKRILVSQPQPSSEKSPYYDIQSKYDVEIVFRPFIKVASVTAREFRSQHVNILDFTAVVFNSRHAIDNFFNMARELRIDIPNDMKYFCVTEQVALYIQKYVQYRKRKVFFGTTGKMIDLLPQMVKHKTEKFFIPLSDVHNDDIANMMDSKNLVHTECVMYRTVSNDFEKGEPFDYDMIIFFSPTGINSLLKNFPNFKKDYPNTVIGTFGSNTTRTAKESGLNVALEAPSPKYPSITAALNDYIKSRG
ncbi:MAG: uroporphyrinogen-III synthase [Prevotellaceae bacterium]|nr:uroporphyrinogen-III synthase [Prevotellaceae bacterium]MCD8285323.1 uroporphyrinogen-III synthase [Prevotellaceae bacterium]MCD8304346.1 uroporphyrinogen-III synthase [Prevotellaceae bacterium]